MKWLYSLAAVFAVLFLAGGCSRGKGAAGFDGIFEKLQHARNFEEAQRCYTDGTVDTIQSAVRNGIINKTDRARLLPLFNDKTEWEELSGKSDGRRGTVRIRYTAHPVENMVGYEMEYRLVKEKGGWKIDLEEEISQALRGGKSTSVADYIRRIKNKY